MIETSESQGNFLIVRDIKQTVNDYQKWEILVRSLEEEYYLWSCQLSDIEDDNVGRLEHSESLENFRISQRMNGSVHSFSNFLSGGSSSGSSSSLVSVLPDNPTNSQFEKYCLNVLTYLSKCVNGPDIIKYCHTEGLYCIDNSGPYNLNNVQVQCNATIVSLCPERYYCPNPYTQIACPRGHFCREGSFLSNFLRVLP